MNTVDEHLASAASDVRDAADRMPLPLLTMVVPPPRRYGTPGWAVAIISAVLVLGTVGGVAWMFAVGAEEAAEPTVTTVTLPMTTTAPISVMPSTASVPTTVPAAVGPVPGDWVTYGTADGLPGTPIDAVAVDNSGVVWALANTDDPKAAQLYSLDPDAKAFEARGEPLTLAGEWYTLWMEATQIGITISLDDPSLYEAADNEDGPNPVERLFHWDREKWMDLSSEHGLPGLNTSFAGHSPSGDVRVTGYAGQMGPIAIDITADGVSYSMDPEGTCCRGTPSAFSIPHAVVPIGPDGRSWFSNGEDGVAALSADRIELLDAETASGCCYVPMAADDTGVWAYFGRDVYRYDSTGWRAEVSLGLIPHVAEVAAMVVTADEDVWVLGRFGGMRIRSDASGNSWNVFPIAETQAPAVPHMGTQSTVTRDGDNVWIANWSRGFGMWLHDGYEWAQIDLPASIDQDGTGFRQNTVAADNGSIWMATSTGFARFDPSP